MNYYNEIDPYAAQWLRNLIEAGHIPKGHVDDRSIVDVKPEDLNGYTQCHFFAGIAGWSLALKLAGWSNDRPVWTGSCPCQPFSNAGQRKGTKDKRHLWPFWFLLIKKCRPGVIFGEQVEAAIGQGWLDAVFDDLESEDYACGTTVLPACAVSAPHIRQRLWFVADAAGERERANGLGQDRRDGQFMDWAGTRSDCGDDGTSGELADRDSSRCGAQRTSEAGDARDASRIELAGFRATGELANDSGDGLQDGWISREQLETPSAGNERNAAKRSRCPPWSDCDWLPCIDGKARPVEPGTFPLAHGVSQRVGRLRAYGNAIVPQCAQAFIKAYMNAVRDTDHGVTDRQIFRD
jgi:DNA (cytosine-5)-methyltransferase 1